MPNQDVLQLGGLRLSPEALRRIGGRAVQAVKERIHGATNANDGPAKEYSPRGPIYIPLSLTPSQRKAGRSLRGRYSLSRAHVKRQQELFSIASAEAGLGEEEGGAPGGLSRSGRSYKFADYAEFKEFIGHSGARDLEVTGKMMGAVALVEEDAEGVELGFTRDEEQQKMQGNERWEEMWGLSPHDQDLVAQQVELEIDAMLEKLSGEITL